MRKLLNLLVSRGFIASFIVLIQLASFILTIEFLAGERDVIGDVLRIIGVFVAIIVINNANLNPSYKIAWIIVILALPIVGGLLYLFFGNRRIPKNLRNEALISYQKTTRLFSQDEKILKEYLKKDPHICSQFHYLWRNSAYPTYKNTQVTYYGLGEEMFAAMMDDIRKARKFIFLEFFIISKGKMWDELLVLLKEKLAEGIDIRISYDDVGSIRTLPARYDKVLKKQGLNVKVFNPVRPVLAIKMNNRDHRKILVVDGKIAYTGGINLADEYINEDDRFGHWKDGGVRMTGDAVFSFTVMFLQMFEGGLGNISELEKYKYDFKDKYDDGVICPFADSPTDDEVVGESVHLNIINHALNYVYISSPYLILDQEMTIALTLAAKRGVDVRIILPYIPDKWYAYTVTRANYYRLVKEGVKIYEYKPGFMHAKIVLADDKVACLGTINLDYRSYYLHYECGVLMYKNACLKDIKKDYDETIERCILITKEDLESESPLIRVFRAILNTLAPML